MSWITIVISGKHKKYTTYLKLSVCAYILLPAHISTNHWSWSFDTDRTEKFLWQAPHDICQKISWSESEASTDAYRPADNVTLQSIFSDKTLDRACVKGPSYWLGTWKPVWYMACERAAQQCNLATTITRTFTSHGNVVKTQRRGDRHFTPHPTHSSPTYNTTMSQDTRCRRVDTKQHSNCSIHSNDLHGVSLRLTW